MIRPRPLSAVSCWLVSALSTLALWGFQPPRPEDRVLPDFDLRDTQPGKAATSSAALAALGRLGAQQGVNLTARFNPLNGAVSVLSAKEGFLTGPSSDPPEQIAWQFLAGNRDLFGLSAGDLNNLLKVREFSSWNETITHLTFEQAVEGIRVFQGELRVHLNSAGQIVWITSNAFASGSVGKPLLAPEQAIGLAVASVRPELKFQPQPLSGPQGADQATQFDRGPLDSDIAVRLMLFPMSQGLRLAWEVYLEPAGYPQAYYLLVDAADGRLLHRFNIYQYAQGAGTVLQSHPDQLRLPDKHAAGSEPSGPDDPPSGCPPLANFVGRSLTLPFLDAATVLYDAGRLAGNNLHAWRRATGTEGALGELIDDVWRFDYSFDSADAAETHLFFSSNFVHDFFYDLGFDEAAGNFQEDNFERGGLGSDSLNAKARAPGRNNANFSTPRDGLRPSMNIYLWDGRGCWQQDVDGDGRLDIDGDYDLDITIHEYHHGVTHRLNTTFSGNEAGAMGEGGGDFFAYSINNDTDLGEYARPPIGIRRINAKTYADWVCCAVHNNGQIWANTLWEQRERFREDEVGGSPEAGIQMVHQLYIDGLKLSPARPTMLEMRDAMLLADLLRSPMPEAPGGSANYCRMWQEYAERGMGVNAMDTKQTGSTRVVADFDVPEACAAP